MNLARRLVIVFALLSSFQSFASTWEGHPDVLEFLPQTAFIPLGFDDNDSAQVVVEGTFPSSCFKVGPNEVSVNEEKKVIYIKNQVYYYKESLCIQMIVHYTKVIDLGILPKGGFKVVFLTGERPVSFGHIPIAKAETKDADNFTYAPTTSVEAKWDSDLKMGVAKIKGKLVNTCQKIKEIRVNRHEYSNVIEVFPVTEMEGTVCDSRGGYFEKTVKLTGIPRGQYLIHVRVLNGQALNEVVTF